MVSGPLTSDGAGHFPKGGVREGRADQTPTANRKYGEDETDIDVSSIASLCRASTIDRVTGRWTLARISKGKLGRGSLHPTESQPRIFVTMKLDRVAYLQSPYRLPPGTKIAAANGLVDTRAQLSIIPLKLLYQLGKNKRCAIPVYMEAREACNRDLGLIGSLFLNISV